MTKTNIPHSLSTKVACILDEFSTASLQDHWQLCHLTPDDYAAKIDEFAPHFLFVESAWQGVAGSWKNKLFNNPPELSAIVHYCRQQHIPTVFWNKEDPVHFDDFVFRAPIAQLFDYVFTTELDCVPRYKRILQHQRVYWLPFATNFKQHHPLENKIRRPGICFAGSYYAKYYERCQDFDLIMEQFSRNQPVIIYDRFAGTEDPDNVFPVKYQPYIHGSLSFSQIDIAYKGYKTALTLNTVLKGQTMFARRVLELISSNTLVVSNYSRALRLLFGFDLQMITSRDPVKSAVTDISDIEYKKVRLRLLRHVWKHYSSTVVCHKIMQLVFGHVIPVHSPSVLVIGNYNSADNKARVENMFNEQCYRHKTLCWQDEFHLVNYSDYDYFCFFTSPHYYAEEYLSDLIMHAAIFPNTVLTKSKRFHWNSDKGCRIKDGKEYKEVEYFEAICTLFPQQYFLNPEAKLQCIAVDIFNFCEDGFNLPADYDVTVIEHNMHTLLPQQIDAIATGYDQSPVIVEKYTSSHWEHCLVSLTITSDAITTRYDALSQALSIHSTLEPDKHAYLNCSQMIDINTLANPKKLELIFKINGAENTLLDIWYLDAEQNLLRRSLFSPNKSIEDNIPEHTNQIKLAIRIKGPGELSITHLGEGKVTLIPHIIIPVSRSIIRCTTETIQHEIDNLHTPPGHSVEFFIKTDDTDFHYSTFGGYDTIYGGEEVWESLKRGKQLLTKLLP